MRSGKMCVCVVLALLLVAVCQSAGAVTESDFVIVRTDGSEPQEGIEYTWDEARLLLTIQSATPMTLSNVETVEKSYSRIEVADGVHANLILDDLRIRTSAGPAFKIAENSTGNVTITLKGENILSSYGGDFAGIEKSGGVQTGTLTIKGSGSLEAGGFWTGAGIGGGNNKDGSNIVIESGTIYASGSYDGAGIGGGYGGDGINIWIKGGTVNASGGERGAGIGGGYGGDGIEIRIDGGIVKARSERIGAGIGGGDAGNAKNILIAGGEITVDISLYTMAFSIGAGNGYFSTASGIKITGGTIYAPYIGGHSIEEFVSGPITVTAGSIRATSLTSPTNGTDALYRNDLEFSPSHKPEKAGLRVSSVIMSDGNEYRGRDMKTDTLSMLYPFLPDNTPPKIVIAEDGLYSAIQKTGDHVYPTYSMIYAAPEVQFSAETLSYDPNTFTVHADKNNQSPIIERGTSITTYIGGTLYLCVKSNQSTYWQEFQVPARPDAPTSPIGAEHCIHGVTDRMQYQKVGDTEWTNCTETAIFNLEAGQYAVRLIAVNDKFASQYKIVTVTEHNLPDQDLIDQQYLLLATGDTVRLTGNAQGIVWTAAGEAASVDHEGLVTAIKPGTTTIKATLGEQSAVCRIDVIDTLTYIKEVVLETKKLTVPVYCVDGVKLDIALTVPGNAPHAKSADVPIGAVQSAAFVDAKASSEYSIEMHDDRTYIVRATQTAKKRTSTIALTLVDGHVIETSKIMLTPSKKLPKVKGTMILDGDSGRIDFTGAEVESITLKSKPSWLDFDASTGVGKLEGTFKKGKKLTVEATLSGWTRPVTIKASITQRALGKGEPALDQKTVTLFSNDVLSTAQVQVVSEAGVDRITCESAQFVVSDLGDGQIQVSFKDGVVPKKGATLKLKIYTPDKTKPVTLNLKVKIAR